MLRKLNNQMTSDLLELALEVQRNSSSSTVPGDDQFELWVRAVLTGKREQADLVIRVVDAEEAQQFNLQYRNKDYATNVLSFPCELPEGVPAGAAGCPLGDLLVCAPVVAAEAEQQQKAENDHWAHLTVHGILHLLGYDHQTQVQAMEMEALETDILKGLGVSDPYHDH